jgi:hypothetical protein
MISPLSGGWGVSESRLRPRAVWLGSLNIYIITVTKISPFLLTLDLLDIPVDIRFAESGLYRSVQ